MYTSSVVIGYGQRQQITMETCWLILNIKKNTAGRTEL
jgi:hypothetical protein